MLVRRARFLPRNPEIVFSDDSVSMGTKTWPVGHSRKLKEISIYEEGRVNVMKLVYERQEVSIPIPRGRLREALDLRKKLMEAEMARG